MSIWHLTRPMRRDSIVLDLVSIAAVLTLAVGIRMYEITRGCGRHGDQG